MLIPTKLSRPVTSNFIVERERLTEKLNSLSTVSLIFVHSPAGFGKTTLISQWAKTLSNVGWYALDETDNHTEHFASYFVAALMHATSGQLVKTQALVQKHQYASLTALFSHLCIELAELDIKTYIVLDDYHLIVNDEIHGAMRFLLRHIPASTTLVILSRTIVPIGIAKLRVKGKLLEITHAQLAFNATECGQFFSLKFNNQIKNEVIDALCDSVNGWPTALQLIVLQANTLQIPDDKFSCFLENQLLSKPLDEMHLSEYLYEEVFEPLSKEIKTFLLLTSVLRIMCNDICKKLQQITVHQLNSAIGNESHVLQDNLISLEQIEQQGLFLYKKAPFDNIDETASNHLMMYQWYGYHPLFQSFLQKTALENIPEALSLLHKAAAEYWLEIEIPSEAIYHAQFANNELLLLVIMQRYAWTYFHQSKLSILEDCFKALSDDNLILYPELVLLKAWLAQSQNRQEVAELILSQAEIIWRKQNIQFDLPIQGAIDALRAQVAVNLGQVQQARKYAHDALGKLDIETNTVLNEQGQTSIPTFSQIVANSVIGEVYHCEGKLNAALQSMQETVVLARRQQAHHYVLWAMIQQSEILMAQGQWKLALEQQERGLEYIELNYLSQLPLHEFLLRVRAQLLLSLGRIDEAESTARQGLLVVSHYKPQKQLQCLAILARCGLVRGALNHAQTILQKCESLVQSDIYHQDWVHNVDKARVIYWQLTDNLDAANNWLLNQNTEIGPPGNHFTQGQSQNIVRALILVERFDDAKSLLDDLIGLAGQNNLVSDLNRNYILLAIYYYRQSCFAEATISCVKALELAITTGFISEFMIEGKQMLDLLVAVVKGDWDKTFQTDCLKEVFAIANMLKTALEKIYSPDIVQFDEGLIEKVLSHPDVPQVLQISPLTLREWQVLGLIYSGLSNDDICHELDFAMTTLKTHIRNIYQKINVSHRAEAIKFSEQILKLV